jgi:hypothetical protein
VELAKEDRDKTTFLPRSGGCVGTSEGHKDTSLPVTAKLYILMQSWIHVLEWSDNLEKAFFRICAILPHCNQNGMGFSPEKFKFAKETVEFAGFKITMEVIKPTDKYVEAIMNFPNRPTLVRCAGGSGSSIKWPTVSSIQNTWIHYVTYSASHHPYSGTMTWRLH